MIKKPNGMILGMIAASSILLSACASQAETKLPEVVKVQNVESIQDRTVTVSSRETVKVVPDMAEIVYGIYTDDADASVCQQKNTEKLNAVLEYLKNSGYEESSMQTSDYSLNPIYDWSENTKKLTGYEMRTQLTLSNVPLDDVGGLLSKAVETGANEIQSVTYSSSAYDASYQEALTKAMNMAMAKAEVLAQAGGDTLGRVMRVQEHSDSQSGRYVASNLSMMKDESMAGGVADMGVMPGEMEVSAQISVDFALIQK